MISSPSFMKFENLVIIDLKNNIKWDLTFFDKFFKSLVTYSKSFSIIELSKWYPWHSVVVPCFTVVMSSVLDSWDPVFHTPSSITGTEAMLILNILNCFQDYKRYIHILNRILDLPCHKHMKWTLEQQYMCVVHSQYHSYCSDANRSVYTERVQFLA